MQKGDVFTRLTVIGMRGRYAVCMCSCGSKKEVRADHLRSGATRSCGCLHSELSSARSGRLREATTKHGKSRSRCYSIWCGIVQRCENPKSRFFCHYGGRGITLAPEWRTFSAFHADMGDPPDGYTIERRNNDGPYSTSNCIWASRRTQQNNRRCNRSFTSDGVTHTVAEWSRLTGVHHNTITRRIDMGWPASAVLSPEHKMDLSGLSRGGKANGERLKALTHCKRGHLFDEANTHWNGKQRVCRLCRRDAARDYRATRRSIQMQN